MTTTITIPKEYGYVVGVAATTFLLSAWHGHRVGPFRKAAAIPYPHAYASAEQLSAAEPSKKNAMYLFNCAQRAHYQFIEHYPQALAGLLVTGIKYPVASASLGAMWIVSRVFYATGYTNKDKEGGKGRYSGGLGMLYYFAEIGWLGMGLKMAADIVLA
ncbi:glutation S-transferase [Microthyrium microscopicum]|uniref:Glutation S-transferase n=1 Tax=Microthyrium microscopicum TaxID=703497 RepID=A0A6A6UU43_9PEZI|nr:glutation S-transferase [Microthyrium microscopicum]